MTDTRIRSFRGSSSLVATMQPWTAHGHPFADGFFFGYQVRTGRPVYMNVAEWKRSGLASSTICQIVAPKNHGKSTLMKSMMLRSYGQQVGLDQTGWPVEHRTWVNDRKPEDGREEFATTADYLLADRLRLADLDSVNIFDMGLGMREADIAQMALNVLREIKAFPLDGYETAATIACVHNMVTAMPDLCSPMVLQELYNQLDAEMMMRLIDDQTAQSRAQLLAELDSGEAAIKQVESLFTGRASNLIGPEALQSLQSASVRCIGYLEDLLGGRYGTLFRGTRSLANALRSSQLVIDWTGIPPLATELLDGVISHWLHAANQRGDNGLIPNLLINEEEGSEMKGLAHAYYKDELYRKSRAFSTVVWDTTQYLTDMLNIGEPGSALRGLGRSIYKSYGVRLYGKQPPDDETRHLITQQGISDDDAYRMTNMSTGCWAIHFPGSGEPVDFIYHKLLQTERGLVKSNSANTRVTETVPVSTLLEMCHPPELTREV